ncbi:MAG: single-stranded DNA-binding protein [Lentisphaerae bacterium]|nr:single-stranded DNA-binding protein [Lentisphaerota bacterium]
MANLNRVFLVGNLTKDPEVRYTSSGKAVGDLRLAVTSKFRDSEDTCYVDVTVWERQAETCEQYLSKGSPVLVEGRLKFDEWERDGQKRSKLSVVASRVQFLGAARGDSGGRDAGPRGGDRRRAEEETAADEPPADNSGGETLEDDDNLPF